MSYEAGQRKLKKTNCSPINEQACNRADLNVKVLIGLGRRAISLQKEESC